MGQQISDFDAEEPARQCWALARRSITKPDEIAYYLAYAPLGTTVKHLVTIAGMRWAIEQCFQATKNERSLDQYEVRRYTGWMRHVTLAVLANAFLAALTAEAGALVPLTVAGVRRLLAAPTPRNAAAPTRTP